MNVWSEIKQNLPTVATIAAMVIAVANFWVVGAVAPLATQVSEVKAEVRELNRIIDIKDGQRDGEVVNMDKRLERIENKLDKLIDRL